MKGQISFDFILAVTVAMVLIASISAIAQDINEMQKESVIRTQAKKISLEVARIYSLSETLGNYDTYEIRYNIPRIIDASGAEAECTINIEKTKVSVLSGTIAEETPMNLISGPSLVIQRECGSQLVIP